jgi:hypothetical protein
MPDWAPRKGERCGVRRFCDVRIATESPLPLCKVHAQKLIAAADALILAQSWAS